MRSILALLGGFSISALGVALTMTTTYDSVGVLLIAAGALVAALTPRVLGTLPAVCGRSSARSEPHSNASLGARLAQRGVERRRAG